MEKLKPQEILDNNKEVSSTFCVLPWLHMATRTFGELTPCCVGGHLGENLNHTTFSQAWNSSAMRRLRNSMLSGRPSAICKRCYNEEKAGVASHRIRSNLYWKDYYSFDQFIRQTDRNGYFKGNAIYLDMRLGNKCNLECTMCSPQETVRWESLSQKIQNHARNNFLKNYFKNHQDFIKLAPSKLWYEREDVKEDIYRQIPFLKRITIAGGEPLLIKEHYNLLDECINQKSAHHISLHYHTNGTVLGSELFDKWSHFDSVMVFFSIDDIAERNRYIRYPCPWEKIEKNLELIDKESPKNVHPMILCTIQIKNIFYFDEFLDCLMDKRFKKVHAYYDDLIHTEVVHHPVFLNCQILPQKVKKLVSEKFENIYKKFPAKTNRFKTIIDFMNGEDKSDLLPVFKDYVQALDKARGTNFAKTFPELSELLFDK